jgi:chemotaxis protein MotA
MDIATIVGLIIAAVGIIGGFTIEGGKIPALINIPGFMIVIVGTFGATMSSFPLSHFLAMPMSFIRAMKGGGTGDAGAMAAHLVEMADKARREGLLALEEEAQTVTNPFAKKALMLIIDGTDPEALKAIMDIEMEGAVSREAEASEIYKAASGFAPTHGGLGAVMGLIEVLSHLGGDTAALGKGIATAFVATFYGVGFANVVLLPIATKLKGMATEEQTVREMILEGILSIQAGDNPRIVKEKLQGFLKPAQRMADDDDEDSERKIAA